jgi:hypothetical protein
MAEVVLRLTIRDLTRDDLSPCAWTGISATNMATTLERAGRGEVDYRLSAASTTPSARTPAPCTSSPCTAQCNRAGSERCSSAPQQRIRGRSLHRAELGVEEDNPRARALYERLGYVAYGRNPESWDEEAPDGSVTRYETVVTLMRKEPSGARHRGRSGSARRFSRPGRRLHHWS